MCPTMPLCTYMIHYLPEKPHCHLMCHLRNHKQAVYIRPIQGHPFLLGYVAPIAVPHLQTYTLKL